MSKKIVKKLIKILTLVNFYSLLTVATLYSQEIFEINALKVDYNNSKNLIIAEGNAEASNSDGKKISANKILYYKGKNIIETTGNSKYTDQNIILAGNNFSYNTKLKILKAQKNIILTDKEKNKFFFDEFQYDEIKQIGYGENIKVKTSDGSYLESNYGIVDNKKKIIQLDNGKFTTCINIKNNKNEFCPSWSLNSKKIYHDKNKKLITHKHAILKLNKIPVFYTPYISHPDPTVKRQSGFLPPIIKTLSNTGKTIQIPYYWAINKDKDLTFTPVYYFDEHNLYKASYRQVFKNAFFNIESGYSKGYKKLHKANRTQGARNYFFADINTQKSNIFFRDNIIKLKIQRISQENFVRVNKINTNLFKEDIRNLENSFHILSTGQNKQLSLKTGIFENLDLADKKKYTYYLPDGVFSYNTRFKNVNTNFNSYFQARKFSEDQKQSKIRNQFSFETNNYVFKRNGISSKIRLNILNNNIYNDNVSSEKENYNLDNYFTLAFDNNLPLAKFSNQSYQILKPRIFVKYTNGKMKDASDNNKSLNYSDIFSINRTNDLDKPEVGASAGYGIDYVYSQNKINTIEIKNKSSFGIGQVYRSKNESLMPNKSSLNNKSSDVSGYLKYELFGKKINSDLRNIDKIDFLSNFKKNYLSINYNFNIENDFSEFVKSDAAIQGTYNKIFTSLKFEEKNNHVGSERTASINIKKLIKNNYYLSIDTKRNLDDSKSEYIKYGLNFENDCLITSLTFSKDFYYDKDISSSDTLIFGVVFKPFSDNFAPDLSNFIE